MIYASNMGTKQMLATLGYEAAPAASVSRRHVVKDGLVVFTGNATEIGAWLWETGQIELTCSVCDETQAAYNEFGCAFNYRCPSCMGETR